MSHHCIMMTNQIMSSLTSGPGDGFFSSAFQSRLIGNNLHNASMPECESLKTTCCEDVFLKIEEQVKRTLFSSVLMTTRWVKTFAYILHHKMPNCLFYAHSHNWAGVVASCHFIFPKTFSIWCDGFFCFVMMWEHVLLFWCRPGIWLHCYSKKPPCCWSLFAFSLALVPRGSGSKTATGQAARGLSVKHYQL